ncbi:MAG: thioredoxin reductase (NADPH) [Halobacteriales archaeon]|jgi:thioredoxin reductase (NADPH)
MQANQADVAIIGGGPAGIATAQQCVREGIEEVVVFEAEAVGGLIRYANEVENWPGFAGDAGPAVVDSLRDVLDQYDIPVRKETITRVEESHECFTLHVEGENETLKNRLETETVVIATGTRPKSLGYPDEIHEPSWRDYDGERVLIIGGGDVAYDYALRIDSLGGAVTLLRRSQPKALESLVDRARNRGIDELVGEVEHCRRNDGGYVLIGPEWTVSGETLVTAIGREPVKPELGFDPGDVTFPAGETDREGCYIVGSVALGKYRQTSLAWGMGIAAGMTIATDHSP